MPWNVQADLFRRPRLRDNPQELSNATFGVFGYLLV